MNPKRRLRSGLDGISRSKPSLTGNLGSSQNSLGKRSQSTKRCNDVDDGGGGGGGGDHDDDGNFVWNSEFTSRWLVSS